MGRPARAVVAVLGVCGVPGCTEFAPSSDVGLGEAMEDGFSEEQRQPLTPMGREDWSCLVEGLPERESGGASERAIRSVQAVPFAEGDDVSVAQVRACTVRDPQCLSPVTDWIPVGEDGWVDIPLTVGFDGYLEVSGEGYVSTMIFYSVPLQARTPPDQEPALMVDLETAISFDELFLMRSAFPEAAVINLRARDCAGQPAAGVRFNLEPSAVGWYYLNGIPVGTASETTEEGVGGFSDVVPGTKAITAELVADGRAISPPRSVFVRSGWFTSVRFSPLTE